jgi:hypothetical protein
MELLMQIISVNHYSRLYFSNLETFEKQMIYVV